MAEFALIELIRERTAMARDDVLLGIGDDGAVLAPPAGQELVVSTDMLVAGVHFPFATMPFDIGWKALAVNLSDLAAMGARPAWATLALALPDADAAWVTSFAEGFGALARQHNLALVGGDTTRGALTISVTVHGFVDAGHALRRDGARAGDIVCVTGSLGDAAAGLQLALRGADETERNRFLLDRLNRPTPRIAAGLGLVGMAHACVDVSDGLLADLGHVCLRSGLGAEIDSSALPTSAELEDYAAPVDRLSLQLHGDDYELCFCVEPQRLDETLRSLRNSGCLASAVGRMVSGDGVRVLDAAGNPLLVEKSGWEHFS